MKMRFWTAAIAFTLLTVFMCSCNKSSAASEGVKLQGAGASFPAPLYNKWFKSYGANHPDVQVDYQSVGSGGGKKSVIDKTVDFGASDAAMSDEEMARVQGGVQLLPMTAGAIVIAYNVDGLTNLNLSRKAYTGIFLGKIKKWNDPAIAGGESWGQAARSADQRDCSRRRQRHQLCFFQTPEHSQRRVQQDGRHQYHAELASGNQEQGK